MQEIGLGELGPLLDFGMVGVLLFLLIRGWLVTKPAMDRADKEVAYLKKLLADELAAHEKTREARRLEAAGANAASLASAKATEVLLTDLRELHGPEAKT